MLIDYQNVNVYQGENKILDKVNFHVDEGEFIYLIGKVGSGKSSLLKTFYCELDLDKDEESTSLVLGRDVKDIHQKEVPDLRREMGIIFQDFQLLHDRTVRKNLLFVLKATGWEDQDEMDERINEVLEEVGMIDKIDRMPHELSGGEQQRIAIARAILNKPKIIIADEPTGNLDKDTADNIMQLLKSIAEKGTAVIMSTHNIGLVNKYPGKAFQCQDGKMEQVIVRKAEPKVDEVKN